MGLILGPFGSQMSSQNPYFRKQINIKGSKRRSGTGFQNWHEKGEQNGCDNEWILRGQSLENRAPVYTPCNF